MNFYTLSSTESLTAYNLHIYNWVYMKLRIMSFQYISTAYTSASSESRNNKRAHCIGSKTSTKYHEIVFSP